MLKIGFFTGLLILVGSPAFSQTATPLSTTPSTNPAPECTNTQQAVIYRCVCRIDAALIGGGVSSIPVYTDGSSTSFSASDLTGESCTGTFLSDPCRPTLIGRVTGSLSCIQGTTTSSGGFDIKW